MSYFDSWSSLAHTAVAAIAGYGVLLALLRVSGKRTLAKLSAFDLVSTVALGSTLATIVTFRRLPLVDGLVALALLVALQFSVAWLSTRAGWIRRIVKSDPVLLFYDGAYLDAAIRGSRLTRDEIRAAIRGAGREDVAGIRAVVLETDGSMSVLRPDGARPALSSLSDVEHRPDPDPGSAGAPGREVGNA